jgi:hypothetical protein
LPLTPHYSNNPENMMGRKRIDCRAFPSEMNCEMAVGADGEAELLEAAVQRAVVHEHQDTPDLRQMIGSAMKDGGAPPATASLRLR